uniref:Uncharacterized protein n=1 Tax=Solanum tuberosum TaxID=4113 RepID=M1DC14_SOLTU
MGLGPENRSTTDQLFTGGLLHQPYEEVAKLLDSMVEINKEIKKKQEWDAQVTQVDFLSQRIMELKAQSMKNDKHFSLREYKKGKKQECGQNDKVLSLIQYKIEEQDKVLKEIEENIGMLNQTITSNSMVIQLQDPKINQLISGPYPPFAEESPSYTMADSEDED